MTGVTSYVYPEVRDRIIVDDLPARRWVECASCIESQDIRESYEAEEWARKHHTDNPRHDRFRVVRQTGWKFVPPADESATP
ncbi:hypothetical protein ACIQ6R_14150 [Streptomyces sp. NPDC096048]|uniref:DUF7848 domain-containing protein n=1 Tax=Streptomyces sp. NPDC096048 TaxID=3366072 RepID=UPI00380ECB08